jgi:hypothetical protein
MQRKGEENKKRRLVKEKCKKNGRRKKTNLNQVQYFGSGFNQVSGSISGFRIRIREGKNDRQK